MYDFEKPRIGRKQDTGKHKYDKVYPVFTHSPKFQKIEGLENLVNLEELWLGKNKITKLEVWIAKFPLSCAHSFKGPAESQKIEDPFHAIKPGNRAGRVRRAWRT